MRAYLLKEGLNDRVKLTIRKAYGFKMEVEAMIKKRLTYLTEEYTPIKLREKKQWLD